LIKSIYDVLKNKGSNVLSLSPDATVYSALELMAAEDVGAVLVVDESTVVGIFSEREYARKVILEGRSSLETPVGKIMNQDLQVVTPEMTVEEGLALMTNKRCRHLPVLQDDSLVGVVSIGDLVHAVIRNQGFVVDQLKGYILSD
jgi:CBS domain-containing protein